MVSKKRKKKIKDQFERIRFFFPFRLVKLHLKSNLFLLIIWTILFGIITKNIAPRYGIHYLLLTPEYIGETGPWAYSILGFSIGGFIMAFNIYSYILHGYKFPFIATLSRPFLKFSYNNSIIPCAFLFTYLFCTTDFLLNKELLSPVKVTLYLSAFICGVVLFFILSMIYFITTNQDLFRITGKDERYFEQLHHKKRIKSSTHRIKEWSEIVNMRENWKVSTYLTPPFKILLARESIHYDKELLRKVFSQNHFNASFFEIVTIITLILLGTFREYPQFIIPAGASIILLFTIILMSVSALFSWFKRWTYTILAFLILSFNFCSNKFDFLSYRNYAYGLDYGNELRAYNEEEIHKHAFDFDQQKKDVLESKTTLNQWKNQTNQDKPKLILVNTSGGGIRAMVWAFHTLQTLDKATNGQFYKNTHLITGASGGVIGSSYWRELRAMNIKKLYDLNHTERVSKDLLNALAFSLTTTDLFIRYQYFTVDSMQYPKDRGYAFEKELNLESGQLFNKRIGDYSEKEIDGEIPAILFTPSIINDGRRLLISGRNLSFLQNIPFNDLYINNKENIAPEYIEFKRFFKNQRASKLRFSTAIRMNATFPYVLPMVSLPTTPSIEIMDAGIRDNFGIKLSLHYIYKMKDWIEKNTSGIILLQIRDRQKDYSIESNYHSILSKIISPAFVGQGNFTTQHDFTNDQFVMYAKEWLACPIDQVDLTLEHDMKNNISLSWHLTKTEKNQILNDIYNKKNQKAILKIKDLLNCSNSVYVAED